MLHFIIIIPFVSYPEMCTAHLHIENMKNVCVGGLKYRNFRQFFFGLSQYFFYASHIEKSKKGRMDILIGL